MIKLYRMLALLMTLVVLCTVFSSCKSEENTERLQSDIIHIGSSNTSNDDGTSKDNISSEITFSDDNGEISDAEDIKNDESENETIVDPSFPESSDEIIVPESSESSKPAEPDVSLESDDVADESSDVESSDIIASDAPSLDYDEHTHKFKITNTKKATCSKGGSITYACECGTEKVNSTKALGHEAGNWVISGSPLSNVKEVKRKYCTRCNEILDEVIVYNEVDSSDTDVSSDGSSHGGASNNEPEHTHNFVETSKTEATCTTDGYITYACECGAERFTISTSLGHKAGDWVISGSPLGTVKEIRRRYCTRCNELLDEAIIYDESDTSDGDNSSSGSGSGSSQGGASNTNPEHSHNFVETGRSEATCTEGGSVKYICDCGEEKNDVISALGHEAGDWVISGSPLGTYKEIRRRYCTRCNVLLDEAIIYDESDTSDGDNSSSGSGSGSSHGGASYTP